MSTLVAGQHFTFDVTSMPRPHETWRPLDRAVQRWVRVHQGSDLLASVAAWASYAEGRGDSALLLTGDAAGRHGMAALDAGDRDTLALDPLLTCNPRAGDAINTPFVLEGHAFYLRRNYLHEAALAAMLRERRHASPVHCAVTDDDLHMLFNGSWEATEIAQRDAVRNAVGTRLFVLTGGPGTGKTTTVLRMLLALAREHAAGHAGQAPVIRIAAPTGKAAQRLSDALRDGGMRMRQGGQPLAAAWQPHLDVALGASASTLHRLLGSRGRHGGYIHHADNRLPADIVVVDEASMVDLAMLRALLEALHEDAILLLVGDADQLTSVGTGSVLMDVVQAMEDAGAGDLVRLRHCFRADTRLVPINEAVREGNVPAFEAAWQAAQAAGRAERHPMATRKDLRERLHAWCKRLQVTLSGAGAFDEIARNDEVAIHRCLAALRQQQLLCALREGEFGAVQANQVIEQALQGRDDDADLAGQSWYPGRAVIITRNDPAAGLFNGDMGLCLLLSDSASPPQLQVVFEGAPDQAQPVDGVQPLRMFDPNTLPANEAAFALTIHKSQGSEYDRVAVLLPPDADNPSLSRQLLYTALSRARRAVELWADAASLTKALQTPVRRVGGLVQAFARR